MSKPFKRQRTYTLEIKEISTAIEEYLFRKHRLPIGEYSASMLATSSPGRLTIKMTLKKEESK